MTKENLKHLISDQGLTVIGFVEAFIELNNLHGVGLLALGDMIAGFCQSKLKRKPKHQKRTNIKKGEWILTDGDTGQYGQQLSENVFLFKERNIPETSIHVDQFTFGKIESTINAYGYTLLSSNGRHNNISEEYGDDAKWIIAECLFELQSY